MTVTFATHHFRAERESDWARLEALLERADIEWCDSCAAEGHPMIDSLWTGRRSIGRYSVAIGGSGRRALFGALLRAELARGTSRKSSLPTPTQGDDE